MTRRQLTMYRMGDMMYDATENIRLRAAESELQEIT